MRRKIIIFLVLVVGVGYIYAYRQQANLHYTFTPQISAASFKDYYERKRNFSLAIGVPATSAERLVINDKSLTGIAILYIHGFGASRAEGELVVDNIASELQANVYYARLPGHGLDGKVQASVAFEQYLQEMEEAFLHMHLLGKKIVIIGTSTGSLIATYIAAKYSDRIHAVILASPFWDFADKTSRILNFPGGFKLARVFLGDDRNARWKSDPEKRQHADYEKYWLVKQKFAALIGLNNLRRYIMRDTIIHSVTAPVLGLVYFKDKDHHDNTIDLAQVRKVFPELGQGSAKGTSIFNRLVDIADGNHILLSEYVRTDKKQISTQILSWLKLIEPER